MLFEVVGLQTQMKLVDVLSDAESLEFFALDIVKVCVVFGTVSTNTLYEDFIDKVHFVDCVIGRALELHV